MNITHEHPSPLQNARLFPSHLSDAVIIYLTVGQSEAQRVTARVRSQAQLICVHSKCVGGRSGTNVCVCVCVRERLCRWTSAESARPNTWNMQLRGRCRRPRWLFCWYRRLSRFSAWSLHFLNWPLKTCVSLIRKHRCLWKTHFFFCIHYSKTFPNTHLRWSLAWKCIKHPCRLTNCFLPPQTVSPIF